MPKFLMTIKDRKVFKKLQREADERGITMQELLRAVIIPEWLKDTRAKEKEVE